MPLQVICPGCNARLKAPDSAAGKKTKCPKCQAVVSVPVDAPQAPAASAAVTSPAGKATATKGAKNENWHMQAPDGSQYGPVSRKELDEWFAEGRVSAECQLLREGADQWQWASEVYPSLAPTAPTAPTKAAGFDFLGSPPADDPLGLGNLGPLTTQAPAFGAPAAGPGFPAQGGFAAPSYGAPTYSAPSYAAPSYTAPTNPYSSPASYGGGYSGAQRTGLHPMAIIAGVLECISGGGLLLGGVGCGIMMIVLLVSGGALATSLPPDMQDSEQAAQVIGIITGAGVICLIPTTLFLLAYGGLVIFTGIGIFKRRFWAKIVAIVLSVLHILPQLFFTFMALITLDPCSIITNLVGVAINAAILAAMLIPDVTSDFR